MFKGFFILCMVAISFHGSAQQAKENGIRMQAEYAAVQNKLFRINSWDSSLATKQTEQFNTIAAFINHFPKSENGYYLVSLFINGRLTQIDSLLAMVDSSTNKTWRAPANVTRNRIAITESGKAFPATDLKDSSGNTFSIASLKGKVVLIDFWSSWCQPCRRQIPELKEIYSDFGPEKFTILGISMDDKKEMWLKAIEKDKQGWLQFCELVPWQYNKISDRFFINSIPSNYLLNADGNILGQDLSPNQIRRMVKKELL